MKIVKGADVICVKDYSSEIAPEQDFGKVGGTYKCLAIVSKNYIRIDVPVTPAFRNSKKDGVMVAAKRFKPAPTSRA